MNNKKTTKRALISSMLSLFVCVTMLIGTTFAWFTDKATSGVNTIQSGKLDVVLEYSTDGGTTWADAEGQTLNFKTADDRTTDILWEPGCTYELPLLRVRNNGNLAFKYHMVVNGVDGDAKLLEAIEWTANDAELTTFSGTLDKNGDTSETILIKGHMKESAGNEYQDLTINGIGITVYATQNTVEADSFSTLYDKMATVEDINELKEALSADYDLITLGADIELEASLTIPANKQVAFDLAGHTISGVDTTSSNFGLINVGNGAKLTIEDSAGTGAIILSATVESEWGRYSSVISNQRSTLIVNGGRIEHKGGTSMSYAIDNLTNTDAKEAKTVINGGVVKSSYIGIRQFCNSVTGLNSLEINGGTITGVRRSVWMQNPNAKVNLAELTITDGTLNGEITVGIDDFDVEITGGTYSVDPSAKLSNGYVAVKEGEVWKVVAGTGVVKTVAELQVALDSAKDGDIIVFGTDIVGDITIQRKSDVNVTIDGNENQFTGVMTVIGNVDTGSLTIENIDFVAAANADAAIDVPGKYNNDATWNYVKNITVQNCNFTDPDGNQDCVAISHSQGGKKNWKLINCTVDDTMHSFLQASNIEDSLVIQDCKVYSKNGVNLNYGTVLKMSGCTFDVKGYAVRIGVKNATVSGNYLIERSNLTSACAESDDAVIVFRGEMSGSTLTLVETTLSGNVETTGNANVVR